MSRPPAAICEYLFIGRRLIVRSLPVSPLAIPLAVPTPLCVLFFFMLSVRTRDQIAFFVFVSIPQLFVFAIAPRGLASVRGPGSRL
jgi:hypothetical protein